MLLNFLVLLFIAALTGSIANSLAGGTPKGCLTTIALGFIGALVGQVLAQAVGLPEIFAIDLAGSRFPIVWAIIGGSLFVAALSLISGRDRRR